MADDQTDLYDEFGNYIGPDLDSSSSSDDDDDDNDDEEASKASELSDMSRDGTSRNPLVAYDETAATAAPANAIVLHEDKTHYPSAEEIYGEEVRTAVLDEDAMDLEQPIVEPVKRNVFLMDTKDEDDYGSNTVKSSSGNDEDIVSDVYLASLVANETTRTRRCISLVGHLHCGKTSLMDLFIEQTKLTPGSHGPRASLEAHRGGGPRLTDTLLAEQQRQLSIKSTPVTLCLPDTRGKTYALTCIDCPGHTSFHDETVASLRVSDGAVLVLDAVEGIMLHTEMALRQVISEGLPLILLINKLDRLVLELKLSPEDMYHKLRNLIDSVNGFVSFHSNGRYPTLSPERGNVVFGSSMHGYCFSLESFAMLYLDQLDVHYIDNEDDIGGFGNTKSSSGLGKNLTVEKFTQRLWGNAYLDPRSRTFQRKAGDCAVDPDTGLLPKRTFVQFVLEPLYKMYTLTLGESERDVEKAFRSLGVLLSKEELRSSARPLMRAAFRKYFGVGTGFVGSVVKHM
jgi:U5 small nuclear ribonucleoprotein component